MNINTMNHFEMMPVIIGITRASLTTLKAALICVGSGVSAYL